MKAATIAELKRTLVTLDQGELLEAVLRLARFKKDNKELLTYLLYLSKNEASYVNLLCEGIDEQFSLTPNAHKKTLRKLIRCTDKRLRYSGNKETEVQVRIHFCRALLASDTPFHKYPVMNNMYLGQLKKIKKAVATFHEDIQYDWNLQLEKITR